MATPIDFDKALDDPAAAFDAPEAVIAAPGLTPDQKARILRRWEYDVSEEAVAEEEGMPNRQGADLLHRVHKALQQVTGESAGQGSGPNKHHGV